MKHYKFKKEELQQLPINYHFFEHIKSEKKRAITIKIIPAKNLFMTSIKPSDNFYKPISKCL